MSDVTSPPVYEVAVVGAGGFLGGAVMAAFNAAGVPTVGYTLDRTMFVDGALDPEASRVRTVIWCASRINPVLAAQHPELIAQDTADLDQALAAFSAFERPPRVVTFSSGGTVYGPPATPPYVEDPDPSPVNDYGRAKLDSERQVRSSGLPSVALRISNAYGPGQRPAPGQGVLAHWMEAVLAGQPVKLFGDPDATRDYVFVDDIARAVVAAHLADAPPPIVNVGSGVATTLAGLLDALRAAVAPAAVDAIIEQARSTDTAHSTLDVSLAKEALGWSPDLSLDEGVALMWKWRSSL